MAALMVNWTVDNSELMSIVWWDYKLDATTADVTVYRKAEVMVLRMVAKMEVQRAELWELLKAVLSVQQ